MESRLSNDGKSVVGTAIVFDSLSEDLGFYERIMPEAVDSDLLKNSDILALVDHNSDRGVLARSNKGKGTLKLTKTDKGLVYEFKPPRTALGEELVESISRGDLNGSSFSFNIAPDGCYYERQDGKYIRTVTKIGNLYDVSCVYRPAYSQANDVVLRSSDKAWKEGQASAERSGSPTPNAFKVFYCIQAAGGLKDGERVSDSEGKLLVQLTELRGVKIPTAAPERVTVAEMRAFTAAYNEKCSDLKPAITTAPKKSHELSDEDMILYSRYLAVKGGSL